MLWVILALVAAILTYYKFIKPHSYWTNRGVPQRCQMPLLGDNYLMLFKKYSFAEMVEQLYNSFPGYRYSGIYQFLQPALLLRDPDLIKQVTVKDFEHFTDHRQIFSDEIDPLFSRNLFALTGSRWKDMRATLSPSFTSSKMKMMYNLISDCAENFTTKLLRDAKGEEFEIKDLFTRFTNDIIATTAFGIQVDSYTNKTNDFYMMGKRVTDFTGLWQNIKLSLLVAAPRLCQLLGLKIFSNEARDFFMHLVISTLRLREEKGILRQDMIHLLMEARKGRAKEEHIDTDTGFATVEESEIGKTKVYKKEELTDIDICAQAMIFFLAGFDSVATLMCFMAYELAVNPDFQDKLRNEIDETFNQCNGEVTYEALMKMKYMDMIVSESLRKWPNAIGVDRRCTKPYTIEPKTPDERPVHLELNFIIYIPIFGIHRDPQYFPDPERFDPERFNDENKSNIKPYTYLPFGVGPRNCIGSRFALLETKIIFFHLLSKLEIIPSSKTPIPMKLRKRSFALHPDPGFFFNLQPRKDQIKMTNE